MLNRLKKPNQQGFTIIEVMIVLAIAGLILLIVFLAVPALQRNSRNTAIKNDTAAIAAAISEFASNNDGGLPTAAKSTYASGVLSLNNATSTATTTGKVQANDTVTMGDATTAAVTPAAGSIYVDFGTSCGTVTATTVTPVAKPRVTSLIYAIEQSGGVQAKCQES